MLAVLETDRANRRAVQLHLHFMVAIKDALQGDRELGLRRRIEVSQGQSLGCRITGYRRAENVLTIAVEQAGKVNQLVAAFRRHGKAAAAKTAPVLTVRFDHG